MLKYINNLMNLMTIDNRKKEILPGFLINRKYHLPFKFY